MFGDCYPLVIGRLLLYDTMLGLPFLCEGIELSDSFWGIFMLETSLISIDTATGFVEV